MCVPFEKLSIGRKRSTIIDKYFDSDYSSRMLPLPPPSLPPVKSDTTQINCTAIQEHYKFGLIYVFVCASLNSTISKLQHSIPSLFASRIRKQFMWKLFSTKFLAFFVNTFVNTPTETLCIYIRLL